MLLGYCAAGAALALALAAGQNSDKYRLTYCADGSAWWKREELGLYCPHIAVKPGSIKEAGVSHLISSSR